MTQELTHEPTAVAPSAVPPPDAARSYRANLRLLAAAQKSNRGAAAYSRFVNRPLGRRLAALADVVGLSPNGVTGLSALASAAAIAVLALARPTAPVGVLIGLLLVLGYALDAADGQLARLQGRGGSAGEFLDHMVDAAKTSSLHLAVLVSLYRYGHSGNGALLLLPIGYAFVAAVFFFGIILAEQLRRQLTQARRGPDAARQPLLRALVVLPNDYGLLCVVFLFWGAQTAFLGVYAFLLLANALYLVAGTVRWYREMSLLDRAARTAATTGETTTREDAPA